MRYLTTDERQRLLQECRRSTNKTLYPLVLMALATGARKSELLRLAWRDIDFERGVVHILTSKNERPRSVPLVECARAALLVMPNGRPTVFPGTYQECWYHAVKRAELVDFRFHDLRHCCASYLAMSGVDVRTIAEILGHKTLQMTMRYSHLNTAALTEPLEAMALKFLEAKK